MASSSTRSLFRTSDVALLRAAALPLDYGPGWWPEAGDQGQQTAWLREVWADPWFSRAVRHASLSLAGRVDSICAGRPASLKSVRGAVVSMARYVLRAAGRPTPFGLFAGVSAVSFGANAAVSWGGDHRPQARVDAEWIGDVIDRLEVELAVLANLSVVASALAVRRARRWEGLQGRGRVSVGMSPAVEAVREMARCPIPSALLVERVAARFEAEPADIWQMVRHLVQLGLLVTELRAPMSCIDPLAYLVERLDQQDLVGLSEVEQASPGLRAVHDQLEQHNRATSPADRDDAHQQALRAMGELSKAGRTPLSMDLRLDCQCQLPRGVVQELQRAASALMRLTRRPAGERAWQEYHRAFIDRYGVGCLVPLMDVVDVDAGLGYPAGFVGSVAPEPDDHPTPRDQELQALAWRALAGGSREVVLEEGFVRALGERLDGRSVPAHVEISARVQAASVEHLDRGEFTLVISPARSAGTLTSRFTPIANGAGLEQVYGALPPMVDGALIAQLSFPPRYRHAENICRLPVYLEVELPLEARCAEDQPSTVDLDDLALTATRERLHLVSRSRCQVIEPQVFHALALKKQAPPLARFLAHLPRAFDAVWFEFDWGPVTRSMPFLPRVRYGRTVLFPARWRIEGGAPGELAGRDWTEAAFEEWRLRWRCPREVELRDADRTLRLDLDQEIHRSLLLAELRKRDEVVLTEAAPPSALGWMAGHTHEIAVPLVRASEQGVPNPLRAPLPVLRNATHGAGPCASRGQWLQVKLFGHPEMLQTLVTDELLAGMSTVAGASPWWFVRYRSPREDDHLRIRVHAEPGATPRATAVGDWAEGLRRAGLIRSLALDAYYPEVGRYGEGAALEAAEACFVADSRAVVQASQELRDHGIEPAVLTAVNSVQLAEAFCGEQGAGLRWLVAQPAAGSAVRDRAVADQVVRLVNRVAARDLDGWPGPLVEAWRRREDALRAYRASLSPAHNLNGIMESLLHMHHNRAIGIGAEFEQQCRRLARHGAQRWVASQGASAR